MVLSSQGFATALEDDKAGAQELPSCFRPFTDFGFVIEKSPEEMIQKGLPKYIIVDFPKEAERSYSPPRKEGVIFDTAFFSKCNVVSSGSEPIWHHSYMPTWKRRGLSTHVFSFHGGELLSFIDPVVSKGQMGRNYNEHSLEVLAETLDDKLSGNQMNSLGNLIQSYEKEEPDLFKFEYLLTHGEAGFSEKAGMINNIGELRTGLSLRLHPSLEVVSAHKTVEKKDDS